MVHSERVLKQAADAERTTDGPLLHFQHSATVRGCIHALHVTSWTFTMQYRQQRYCPSVLLSSRLQVVCHETRLQQAHRAHAAQSLIPGPTSSLYASCYCSTVAMSDATTFNSAVKLILPLLPR